MFLNISLVALNIWGPVLYAYKGKSKRECVYLSTHSAVLKATSKFCLRLLGLRDE